VPTADTFKEQLSMHHRTLIRLLGLFALLLSAVGAAVPAHANGSVTLNSAGGDPVDSYPDVQLASPKFIVHSSSLAVIFDGGLVTSGTQSAPVTGPLYFANGVLWGAPHLTALSGGTTKADWTSATVSEITGNSEAQQVLVAGSTTLTVTYLYDGGPSIGVEVVIDPVPTSGTHAFYFVSDPNVRGLTKNTLDTTFAPDEFARILGSYDYDAELLYFVGFGSGIGMAATSAIAASKACVFGKLSGCPSAGPANGAAYGGDVLTAADLAIGQHWDLVNVPGSFGTAFGAAALPAPPPPGGEDDGGEEEGGAAPVVQQCAQVPDMAISPEKIELAAGGRTTLTVTLRNLCTDAPFNTSDLLLSLSDGLSVVDGSAGMVNLGQRAAWQGLSLAAGETRSWTVTVAAADALSVAPVHVAELYYLGAVAKRIDGVFVGATVAAAAVTVEAAPAPVVVPAVPATPAPLPTALPNTAGETTPLWVLGLIALLVLGGLGLRRAKIEG
jgi:hypothetical protein